MCTYLKRLPCFAKVGAKADANAFGYSSSSITSPAVLVMHLQSLAHATSLLSMSLPNASIRPGQLFDYSVIVLCEILQQNDF
jgi:hypothetical protein